MHKYIEVRYIYENSRLHQASTIQHPKQLLTNAAINALPPELVADFKYAVLSVDLNLVAQHIEQIRTLNECFADAIADCINNFEYDKILQLIANSEN